MKSILGKVTGRVERTFEQLHESLRRSRIDNEIYGPQRNRAAAVATHVTRRELDELFSLSCALPTGARSLEIGSYLGASSQVIAAGVRRAGGKLYCVDTWMNETMPEGVRDTFSEFSTNTKFASDVVVPIRKRSDQLSEADFREIGALNFAFIDGDHSYKGVSTDFEIVSEHINLNSVVAFHDCRFFESVSRVVGEALATGNWQLESCVENLTCLRKLGPSGSGFPNPSRNE